MSRQRFAFAWIACFAVLFNMLAMSTAGAMGGARQDASEQFMWSSFCTSTGTKMVAVSLGKLDAGDSRKDDHSNLQH